MCLISLKGLILKGTHIYKIDRPSSSKVMLFNFHTTKLFYNTTVNNIIRRYSTMFKPSTKGKKLVDKEKNGENGLWNLRGDCLPVEIRNIGLVQMKKVSDAWTKDWDADEIVKNNSKVILCGIDRNNPNNKSFNSANDNTTRKTIERYGTVWKNFKDFCLIIGDYRSAIICDQSKDTFCSHRPESVNVETCILFMKFNVFADCNLAMNEKSPPVRDIRGNIIKCIGSWNVERTLYVFKMAISKLHHHFSEEIGTCYMEKCEKCCLFITEKKGCIHHVSCPRYYRQGNPAQSPTFQKQYGVLKKKLIEKNMVRSTDYFTPSNLRDIREYCLSQNSLYYLMMWTIMIVGIKQFLRVQEVLNLRMEDFVERAFSVNDRNVEALAMHVKGKTDVVEQLLLIWDENYDDYKYTEFSASRALLMWIKISGIKKGFLFPNQKDILASNTNPAKPLAYKVYLDFIKFIIQGNETRGSIISKSYDPKKLVGTHVLRKSGYLLAIWGTKEGSYNDIKLASIFQSARNKHSSIAQSARHAESCAYLHTYVRDAETCYHYIESSGDSDYVARNKVGAWRSIHVCDESMFSNNQSPTLPLTELADYYFSDMLKIEDGSFVNNINIPLLHRMMDRYKPSSSKHSSFLDKYPMLQRSFDELETYLLSEVVPEANKEKVGELIDNVKLCAERQQEDSIKTLSRVCEASTVSKKRERSKHVESNDQQCKAITKKTKVAAPSFIVLDEDYRQLTKTNHKDKKVVILLMIKAVQSVIKQRQLRKQFPDEKMKSWIHKIAKPCLCIEECYKGNIDLFLKAHPNFIYSKHVCVNQKLHETPLKTLERLNGTLRS